MEQQYPRQNTLNRVVAEALKDQNLVDALVAFNIGQEEYEKAISSYISVNFISGNTSNPTITKEQNHADMDRNKDRNR